ncbi:MAG: hypothetical protein LBK56_05730 [Gracilibacteraceae bacterium]|nr:hypothetical protein [Gracilibacteraceae bacterium]
MAKRKQKPAGPPRPRTFAERVAAEKEKRQKKKSETNPELTFVFRFGMIFMVVYAIAWPVSAKIEFPLTYCLSLVMYLLLGWLLWRKPRLVISVIMRRGGEMDEESLHKISRRIQFAGIVLIVFGLVLSVMTAGNLSGLWGTAE